MGSLLGAFPSDVSGDDTLARVGTHRITYDEFHAAALGLAGFVVGDRGVGMRTITTEPWYFVTSFAVAYALGRLFRRKEATQCDHERR